MEYNNVVNVSNKPPLVWLTFSLCNLSHVLIIIITGSRCEDGVQQVQCLHNPCDTAQCPNIPDAKCIPSSCGQCSAHFFNTSGHNVTSNCSKW